MSAKHPHTMCFYFFFFLPTTAEAWYDRGEGREPVTSGWHQRYLVRELEAPGTRAHTSPSFVLSAAPLARRPPRPDRLGLLLLLLVAALAPPPPPNTIMTPLTTEALQLERGGGYGPEREE